MNYVVLGLAYGDEGKGTMVDFLCRQHEIESVIRFSGGPQASHHVVLPDGRWHGFSHWGAGTLAGASTYINPHMLIEPYSMANEAERLTTELGIEDPYSILNVHANALVITPWHWRLNRVKERMRGEARHGSCGMGIGEAVEDNLKYGDGIRAHELATMNFARLWRIRQRLMLEAMIIGGKDFAEQTAQIETGKVQNDYLELSKKIRITKTIPNKDVVCEGSQGLLLDETLGFAPYNTWSDLTPRNAVTENSLIIGVVPTIWTRHGAGPFVTEDPNLMANVHTHNKTGEWQGAVRLGHFDLVALHYVLMRTFIDVIALTKTDLIQWPMRVCYQYQHEPSGTILEGIWKGISAETLMKCRPIYKNVNSIKELESLIGLPIIYLSHGPTHQDKTVKTALTILQS